MFNNVNKRVFWNANIEKIYPVRVSDT